MFSAVFIMIISHNGNEEYENKTQINKYWNFIGLTYIVRRTERSLIKMLNSLNVCSV